MVNEIWSRRDQKYDLTLVSSWPAFGLIVTSLWSRRDQALVSLWPAFGHKVTLIIRNIELTKLEYIIDGRVVYEEKRRDGSTDGKLRGSR